MPITRVNRKVLDISHHNSISSWTGIVGAGILGIIHKATEGTDFTDDTYRGRKEGAMAAGLLWGAYHFANDSNAKSQVEHFLDVTGVHGYMLYALDWEDEPHGNTMSLAQAREFMQRVDNYIGPNRCVLYSGNLAKEELGDERDSFFGAHRLWLAQYGDNPSVQASWRTYWLWQYSDGNYGPEPHGCPGAQGDVDTNSWAGTDEALIEQWTGEAAAPPERPERPERPEPEPEPSGTRVAIEISGVPEENVSVSIK